MDVEVLRNYCISKKAVEESFPFDDTTLVFKVGGKIFLLLSLTGSPVQFNVKSDPEKAVELRERYSCVVPGYHMSKKHWNTIICDGSVRESLIKEWIDDSYNLVYNALPKKTKAEISEIE
ncbi:MmcQ/YjbR family DNA-binding protein [Cytophaga aurantiaca]|uniref:MmcQ/YjbR family DNA-binding protein n=1 Tax=Cytophaga aurantiaca TaxID=29530 RepID=UPI0003751992|nr:MmcQ/YjbR family DNA-binding protein [Cytophaga aurantiaca]